MKVSILLCLLFVLAPITLLAARGGGSDSFMMGVIGGFTNSEQTHINTLRERANARAGGISASDLDRAYEFGVFMQWRAGMLGFQLRPTFFTQSEGSGAYEYSTTGYTAGAHFRLYPLESKELKLFFQTAVVWGSLKTKIKEDTFNVEADGANLGYLVGLGVELNFGRHVLLFEAGWRYLPIERNIVTTTSGTPASNSVSQSNVNQELEFDDRDLSTNMSGTQVLLGYGFNF